MTSTLEQARAAFAKREWQAAYDAFAQADGLTASDLDSYGECAHWLGNAREVLSLYTEASKRFLEEGNPNGASYAAFMLAIYYRLQGEPSTAQGWSARAQRLLADEPESAEHGYPLFLEIAGLMDSDIDAALAGAHRMQDLGKRFGDETLIALGVLFEGRIRIKQARVPEGLALLDEAMVAALSDQLKPMWTGAIYCGLLDCCHELADVQRAREWTDATTKWCSPLPVASLYPGICRVHRAELIHLSGDHEQAEAEALAAIRDMADIDVFVVADGFYEIGEIRRRRGDLAGAEEAYDKAHAIGRDPQPGMALLRCAQGNTAAALSSIATTLGATGQSPLGRAPLLGAQVDIALAAGNIELARASVDELTATANLFGSSGLKALSHRWEGAVALAEGEAVKALAALRQANASWQELEAPYEQGRTRQLLARAYEALDDVDAARRETAAANAIFERIGMQPPGTEAPASASPVTPLSPRELEVLRLVATGQTNREIAEGLFLSEKTVARHIANIFTKLDLNTRAAATAYAFANGLAT